MYKAKFAINEKMFFFSVMKNNFKCVANYGSYRYSPNDAACYIQAATAPLMSAPATVLSRSALDSIQRQLSDNYKNENWDQPFFEIVINFYDIYFLMQFIFVCNL